MTRILTDPPPPPERTERRPIGDLVDELREHGKPGQAVAIPYGNEASAHANRFRINRKYGASDLRVYRVKDVVYVRLEAADDGA